MTSFRHCLRLWAAAWLVFQVATLSALVPRDCCAAHKAQHEKPQSSTAVMDHSSHSGHHSMNHGVATDDAPETAPMAPAACVLRGTCRGPMSAVVALLSSQGVPPTDSFTVAPELRAGLIDGLASELAISRFAPPDPRPPRA
jgi:hypothetical protein